MEDSSGPSPVRPARRGPFRRMRDRWMSRWAGMSTKQRNAVWVGVLVLALLAGVLMAPRPAPTTDPAPDTAPSASQPDRSASGRSPSSDGGTGTGDGADGTLFQGDAQAIGGQVRDMLDSPSALGTDTLSTLLYRHGRKDLADASGVFDAIGREEPVGRIRQEAVDWHRSAMDAGAAFRLADLEAMVPGARKAARYLKGLDTVPRDCGTLDREAGEAERLTRRKGVGYDALTERTVSLNQAVILCSGALTEDQRDHAFGDSQQDASDPSSADAGEGTR